MATNYPESTDSFPVPTLPEATPLSEAGTGTRNHVEHHADLGAAVVALEGNAAFGNHDHSGAGNPQHGNKLVQANTHQSADTDTAVTALHHTLGPNAFQAAPGNHVHHYSQILDRPYIVCTSSTRPTNPFIGMQIYETDTNTVRVWAVFPTNPTATGVIGSDNFHRTNDHNLDNTLWHQYYFLADHGYLCTPYGISAYWLAALELSNWCRARRIWGDDRYTDSDDQEITVTHGTRGFDCDDNYGDHDDSPCHDHYFRMSDDELHYCRVGIFQKWAILYYTNNGYANEVILGHIFVPDWEPGVIWTIRVIDWEFQLWRNGIHCGSIVDNGHHHSRGPNYRGWGFGHRVRGHSGGQYRPPEIVECQIRDVTSYVPTARWGLLPVASVPILIAETRARQQVFPALEYVCFWTHLLEDKWGFFGYPGFYSWAVPFALPSPATDITVTEPGVYHVHASVCWDKDYTFHDHSMISVKVNGQDVGRKNWEFIRGYEFAPGFAQTNEINFWYRFNAGDVLRVVTRHNAVKPCWLWWDILDPDRQVCHVELVYHTP